MAKRMKERSETTPTPKASKAEKERLKAERAREHEEARDPRWDPAPEDVVRADGRWTAKVRARAGNTIYGWTEPDGDPMPFTTTLTKWWDLYHHASTTVVAKAGVSLTSTSQPKFTPRAPRVPRTPRPRAIPAARRVGTRLR